MPPQSIPPLHVSLVAIPEGAVSTLHGIYDVLNSFKMLAGFDDALPASAPFRVEIVGMVPGEVTSASGLATQVHRSIKEVTQTHIIIVPSVVVGKEGWQEGRYGELVDWITRAHEQGAVLCSACSGMFLLGETGLFNDRDATMHWTYANVFRAQFPRVRLHPERALVASGSQCGLVSSGASMSWHDLVLYLIARFVSPTAAQAVARFFALQWHRDGLGPYIVFEGRRDHGDAAVLSAQDWLAKNFSVANPVEEVVRHCGMAERTLKRRFSEATGMAPLPYVQQLRIAEAKRRLERTRETVDEVGWRVGYEDPAFFRRLFKRITGVSPAGYRKQVQIPQLGSN